MLKRFKVLILLASLSLSLCLMSNTYSRYVADTTGDVKVLLAKWQILVNNNDVTNNDVSEISFVPVIEDNENVKDDKFAPSSKGYFDIVIDPTNVDVSFKYTIGLAIENENIPDLMITKYAVLPENYVEGTTNITYNELQNNKIEKEMLFDKNVDNFSFKPFTIRVYFEWYEGEAETMSDSDDTVLGLKAATEDTNFTMKANIKFEQIIKKTTQSE